ncbi:MAG: cyclic nucleotide-binding domain-containing protein [Anaerolineae bacterium]
MSTLIESLRRNTLLQTLEDSTLDALLPDLERITLNNEQVLFSMGESGDSYYIIESGTIKITSNDLMLNHLNAGESFGEMALLTNQPRSATASADPEASLIRIPRVAFLRLIDLQPTLADEFYALMQDLMRYSLLTTAFSRIFGVMDDQIMREIEQALIWETYKPSDVILKQGAEGDDALVIVSGRVQATLEQGHQVRVLGEVGTGSIVGEIALLSDAPRSATVTAIRETRVARMSRDVITRITHAHPDFALRLMEIMVKRQQHNFDQNYVEKPSTLNIAIVPTQAQVDTALFAQELANYLSCHGSTLVLNQEQFDKLYGLQSAMDHTHPMSAIVQLWLDELEREYDYVVYLTDHKWSPWTDWVTRCADRVLLIGEAQSTPKLSPLEHQLREQGIQQRQELVLWHEANTERPQHTRLWLQERQLHRHYHVRKGDGAHYARLARLLTGNGIGLVLSGGGARGYVHLGVIRALMEQQVPLDAIGSTSMGSVIGAALAVYMDYEKIQEKAQELGSRKAILDFTMPVSALMRSKKISNVTRSLYADYRIEDSWLPFFCVSTNLSKASMILHTEGSFAQAVRASISIPGVFTPVNRGGDLLVDGGVMNNYPVDVMRQFLEGGTIIGTLVSGSGGKKREYDIPDHIDGWRTFLSGFVPGMKRRRVPSILKTILGSTSVNSEQFMEEFQRRTDFLLQTDAHPYGILDFDMHRELAQKGYETHLEPVGQWAQRHARLIDQPPMW